MNIVSAFIDDQQDGLELKKKLIWFDFEFFCQIKMCFEIKNSHGSIYDGFSMFLEKNNWDLDPVCLLESSFLLESGFLGKWIPEKWIIFRCLVVLWKMNWKILFSVWLCYEK